MNRYNELKLEFKQDIENRKHLKKVNDWYNNIRKQNENI